MILQAQLVTDRKYSLNYKHHQDEITIRYVKVDLQVKCLLCLSEINHNRDVLINFSNSPKYENLRKSVRSGFILLNAE